MGQARKQNSDTFNTMHKLEQAGMSRTQAEITARAIDQQVSLSVQQVLDKIDARFDAVEKRFEDRFDMVDARFDAVNARFDAVNARFDAVNDRINAVDTRINAVEKRFSWVAIEGIIAISVLGIGFVGVILALLQ